MDAKQALPNTQTMKLTARLPVVWIHGRTGQQLEETTLPPGAMVSAWAEGTDGTGQPAHLFLASQDDGETWNRYQCYESPEVAPINPRAVDATDEQGNAVTVQESRGPKPPAAARKAII